MATDENNHKNEARDDWTGCTFRVERGPSSEGRAWGMADILTDVPRRVWPARPGISPRRPARDQARPRGRLTAPAQAFAGHAEDHWIRTRRALCANVLDEFVRALLPRSTSRRAGRPVGSTPLRVRTVFFKAVMFPLHCYPHIVLLLTPRVVSFSPPALIRSSKSNPTTCFSLLVLENDTILPHTPQGPGEMFRGRGMVPARPGPSSCTSRRAAPSRRTGRRSTTGGGPRGSRSPRRPCRAARGWSSRGRRRPRRRC